MAWLMLILPVLAAGMQLAHPHLDPRATCKQDDCYRAVQHTTGRYSTRAGTADCSSYLIATVTPATTTVTTSVADAGDGTVTTTVPTSYTYTIKTTTTPRVTTTTTKLSTSTIYSDTYIPNKRQVTSSGSDIPAYAASVCSGDATSRYISACSCMGVTASTITAATPTTTATVSGATSTETEYDYSVIYETRTSTAPTRTFTSTTTTLVATTTAVVREFLAQAVDGRYKNQYLRLIPQFPGYPLIEFTRSLTTAERFYFDDTVVYSVTHPGLTLGAGDTGVDNYVYEQYPGEFASLSMVKPLKCSINPDNTLACSEQTHPEVHDFIPCAASGLDEDVLAISSPQFRCRSIRNDVAPVFTLRALYI